MTRRVGVYPGTFDPITNGHLDIIARAASMLDQLVIGVGINDAKSPILPLDERIALANAETAPIARQAGIPIEARPVPALLVDFARDCGATLVVRGLRGGADFDYEQQLAGMNRRLAPEIDTIFLMASETNRVVSSSLVRQIAQLRGDISGFVPPATLARVLARLRR